MGGTVREAGECKSMAKQYEIHRFADELAKALPGVEVRIDPPNDPRGRWWLDADYKTHSVVVAWQAGEGFGVSSSPADVFEMRSDEDFATRASAVRRAVAILQTGEVTVPSWETPLGAVRLGRRLSQVEVAKRLNIQQARVSRMERQSDMKVSSLAKYIEALGGRLRLVASFDEGDVELSADNGRGGS
jgi:hypothetical protein